MSRNTWTSKCIAYVQKRHKNTFLEYAWDLCFSLSENAPQFHEQFAGKAPKRLVWTRQLQRSEFRKRDVSQLILEDMHVIPIRDPSYKTCSSPHDSRGLKVFRNYSRAACIMECKWDTVDDKQMNILLKRVCLLIFHFLFCEKRLRLALSKCGCIAWDYPRLDEAAPVCNFFVGTLCFRPEMRRARAPLEQCPSY